MKMILTSPVSKELEDLSSISEISCEVWGCDAITQKFFLLSEVGSDVGGFWIE